MGFYPEYMAFPTIGRRKNFKRSMRQTVMTPSEERMGLITADVFGAAAFGKRIR